MQDLKVNINGTDYNVKVEELDSGKLKVYFDDEIFEVETKSDIEKQLLEEIGEKESSKEKGIVLAPLPGIIFSIDVEVGTEVKKGGRIMTLMAMKMENEIGSPKDGKIKEIKVKKDDQVNQGDVLAIVE